MRERDISTQNCIRKKKMMSTRDLIEASPTSTLL